MWISRPFCAAVLFILLSACSSDESIPASFVATAPEPASATSLREYNLSPGDLIDISVFQVPDLTREVQVDASGQISLPLIGDLHAAGKTLHMLQAEIANKLRKKYLQSPQVTIFLKSAAGQQVTVTGQVIRPGSYPIVGHLTLIRILAQAGDLNDVGDPNSVRVFRQENGGRTEAKFNIDDIRSGKAPDPELYAGDMVVVDSSDARVAWKNAKDIMSPMMGPASIAATVIR